MSETVTLKIDGQEVTVPKGTTILDAAAQIGIEIPVICYHPHLKHLPPCARPGKVCIFMMTVASMVYVGFAAACLYWEILG